MIVSTQNDRHPNSFRIADKFHLRQKLIEGKIVTRMDYAEGTPMAGRSVISDGTLSTIFETTSQRILQSVDLSANFPAPDLGKADRLAARLDAKAFETAMAKLSFRSELDDSGQYAIASATSGYLTRLKLSTGKSPTSFLIVYDLQDSVIAGSELVIPGEEGETVTIDTHNQYQVVNDVPILVGVTTEEHHTFAEKLPLGPDDLPQTYDPETTETITLEQLEELRGRALVTEIDPPVGDRTDPNYVQVTTTRYDNIVLNETSDADLRIAGLGGKR